MREAVGGSLLMNLVVIFTAIVILFFVGIISYSKAYGVKNRIISIVEKYGEYDSAKNEINADLLNIGYRSSISNNCDSSKVKDHLTDIGLSSDIENLNKDSFNYCIYKVTNKSSHNSNYYVVVTFVSFEFPLIGDMISYPVYGETRILGKTYDY